MIISLYVFNIEMVNHTRKVCDVVSVILQTLYISLARVCFWQGSSSKARVQRDRDNSVGSDSGSSICTVNSSLDRSCLDDPLTASTQLRPTSPLK